MSKVNPSRSTKGPLTPLQVQIVLLLGEGYTQGEIADKIGYGRQWVCEQTGYLVRKMNAHNAMHAACLWARAYTYTQAASAVEETVGRFAAPDASAERHAAVIANYLAKDLRAKAAALRP